MYDNIWFPFTQHKLLSKKINAQKAYGSFIYDTDGNKYLDMISSWWVNLHGHSHSKIVAAVSNQIKTLDHVIFADSVHKPALNLSHQLISFLPQFQKVFFSDNGSTAVEVALKMSLQYFYNLGIKKDKIIAFQGGYHGDTFGAMSVGASSGFFRPFLDKLFDVSFVKYPETWFDDSETESKEQQCLNELEKHIKQNANIASIIIEPIMQGAGGMRYARPSFLSNIIDIAHKNNILVIFDEIMTGFGRLGKMFASNITQKTPDFVCLSKGITGGTMPLAATLTTKKIYDAFLSEDFSKAFAHGHSYTANPISCAAANASLEIFSEENTIDKIQTINKWHHEYITKLNHISKIRIVGSIAAFNFRDSTYDYSSEVGKKIKNACIAKGILIRPLGNVVYLMPPYCIDKSDLEYTYHVLQSILHKI